MKLVISQHVVDKAEVARSKPYWSARYSPEEVVRALTMFREKLTPITVVAKGVASHWRDDLVIATAVSGNADYLVTGDKELRAVNEFQGVKIRTPQEFLEEFERPD